MVLVRSSVSSYSAYLHVSDVIKKLIFPLRTGLYLPGCSIRSRVRSKCGAVTLVSRTALFGFTISALPYALYW